MDEDITQGHACTIVEDTTQGHSYKIDEDTTQGHACTIDEDTTQGHSYKIDEDTTQGQSYMIDENATEAHACKIEEDTTQGHVCKVDEETTQGHVCMTKDKGLEDFDRFNVGDDGNCLFRALALVLEGDENRHQVIRNVVNTLRERQEEFEMYVDGSVEKYISNMSKYKGGREIWGTEAKVIAAAHFYDKKIIVYDKHDDRCSKQIFNPRTTTSKGTIYLILEREHYNLLREREVGKNTTRPEPEMLLIGWDKKTACQLQQNKGGTHCKRSRQSYNILSYLSVGFWAPARLLKGSSGKACCNCLALLHYRSLVYILIRLLICRCSRYEAKLKSICANYCNCLTCKEEIT